jgi:hypothetical protein
MTLKEIFERDLRGYEYLAARGLSPDSAMQGERQERRLMDRLPAIIRITEGYQPADELRFVGAI